MREENLIYFVPPLFLCGARCHSLLESESLFLARHHCALGERIPPHFARDSRTLVAQKLCGVLAFEQATTASMFADGMASI